MSFQVIGRSVIGAVHRRQGLPNQDAFGARPLEGGVVVAVADGHGSARCARSDIGARLAVEVALDAGTEFLAAMRANLAVIPAEAQASLVAEKVRAKLTLSLLERWQRAVRADAAEKPPIDELYLAYGTTLLVALLTEERAVLVQLGDGELLAVCGAEAKPCLPADPRLMANETTSLARAQSADFRVAVEAPPAPVYLLTTDGYPNSFRTPEGFAKAATDLAALLTTPEILEAELESWLAETSDGGSGDDATLALAWVGGEREAMGVAPGDQEAR